MRLDRNTILFNVAGVGILLVVVGYMANSFLASETVEVCRARYGDGEQFALRGAGGKKLTNIELQARVPTREWGLLSHARVVQSKDGEAQYLQVALGGNAATAEDGETDAQNPDGVGFIWLPSNLKTSRAACLSYRLFLPKDFSFDAPGKMPALFATRQPSDVDEATLPSGFTSRLAWQKGGAMGVSMKAAGGSDVWMGVRNEIWPRGRWIDISQEVILNAPNKSNGLMRVWVDGVLRIDRADLNLGTGNQGKLSGVLADLGYDQPASKTGRMTITPFVVQHQ